MGLLRWTARNLLVLVMLAGFDHAFGQLPLADVSGKWAGALDVVHRDGSVDPGQAFLSLVAKDGTIGGTALRGIARVGCRRS